MISVIVSTFDRPAHLDRCLESLARQEGASEAEVVVADDGSGPATAGIVEAWARRASCPIVHARQERRGFRLAAARNTAVRASRGERLIFLDGDCVVPPGFLAVHLRSRRPRRLLAGGRFVLDRDSTALLLEGESLEADPFARIGRRERIRVRLRAALDRAYRWTRLKDRPKALGAHLALEREDFLRVNGFDERYEGWGHEDEDFARRLVRSGVRKDPAPEATRVLHLWHPCDPTFAGSAAASPNTPRHRRGWFLARSWRGLAARRFEDLRLSIRGLPELAALGPAGGGATLGRAPAPSPAPGEGIEVEVRGSAAPAFDPAAEIRVAVLRPGEGPGAVPLAHLCLEWGSDLSPSAFLDLLRAQLEEVL